MKFRWGLVGVFIFVFLLIAAPIFSAVSITIVPANPVDSDNLVCLMNGAVKNFNAHWKGSGVTQQNVIANPLPASMTKVGTVTCDAYVPNPLTGVPLYMGSSSVIIRPINTCLLNQTPQLNIPTQNLNQNSQLMLNLLAYATDAENDLLTFTVANENTTQANCDILANILTINTSNYNGTASCTINVADSCNFTSSLLNINVGYVDLNPPIVNLIDNIVMDEDTNTTLNLDSYVSDADDSDSALIWNVSGNVNVQITIDPLTHNATFMPNSNWFGSENVTFTARDIFGNYGQDNVMIIVNPINDMPWIDPIIPDQTVQEDALPWTVDLKNYQHDIEAGPLTWSVFGVDNSLLNINIDSNNIAVFSLVPNKNGTNTVTFTLKDSYGANVSQNVLITVGHLNHIPVINAFSPILNYVLNEGQSQLFSVTASDIDNDTLSYSWLLDGVNVGNTNTFNYSALNGPETHTLIANVSDGLLSATMTWTISVLNLPPTVTAVSDIVNESQSTTVTTTASDPGILDVLTYSFDFNNDGNFEVQNSNNSIANYVWAINGIHPIRIIVNDNNGGTASIIINAQVLDLGPNAIINAPLNITNEGSPLSFSGNFSTSSPDLISTYEWDWNYNGAFIAQDTGIDSSHIWMDNGTYVVGLRVIDSDGSTSIDTMSVTINDLSPVADFIFSSNNSFVEPSTVSFIDTSSSYPDLITNWAWDFDNNGVIDSNIQFPTHDFIQNGTYLISLTVTDEDGSTNTVTFSVIINDTHPLITSLSGNLNILEGTEATFNSIVKSYDGIVNYQWNFGDTNITDSNLTSIKHLFAQNGTYPVILNVYEADGDYNTSIWNITVGDTAPQVFINSNGTFVNEGSPLQFYGNNSHAYDGIPLTSYFWNFGDGTNDTIQNPVHNFTQDGVYDVYLTVTDSDGSINTTRLSVGVIDINPIANFTFNPLNPLETDLVSFTDLSYTYDGIINYTWNFGDGNTTYSVQNPAHNYESGNYNIVLTVYEQDGDSSSITKNIIVNDTKPFASFTYLPNPAFEWNNITFTSTSTYPHDPIVSWLWNFGDGNTASGNITNHIYSSNGTYNATLTITDSDGSVEQTSQIIDVQNTPVNVTLSAVPTTGNEPLNVTFTCTATGNAPFNYSFNFLTGSVTTVDPSFVVNTIYNNGTYNATCTVTDKDGDTNYTNQLITVNDLNGSTAFYFNPLNPIENQSVQFTDNSTYVIDPIVSWLWNFGDGKTNNTKNPIHNYLQNGTYNVVLTTIDVDGSTNSTTLPINIGDTAPTVNIVAPSTIVENITGIFSGSSIGYDLPLSYSWNFGDGNTTIGQVLSHSFAQNGTYTITLTVSDNDGSTNSTTSIINVTDTIPFASFAFNPLSPMEGDNVQFTDNSSAYDMPITWAWDFESDGVIDNITQNPTHNFTSGPYQITLTVTDSDGSKVNATRLIAVGDFNPIANFTFTSPIIECSPATLTSNSISVDGIINYTWNFGDGNTTTTTLSSIPHTFKTILNGLTQTFVTTLTVVESDGDSSSITKNIIVNDTGVNAVISNPLNNTSFPENSLVNFNGASSSSTCDSIISYAWNFGDLTPVVNGNITNHTYLSNGTYIARLTVTDSDGSQDIEPLTIIIGNNAPSVTLNALPLAGGEPTNVTFTCSVINGDMPYTYSINFGNGVTDVLTTNSTTATFITSYLDNATYVGRCTITDVDGDSGNASSLPIIISDVNPIAVISNPNPFIVNSGVPVTLYGNNSLSGSSSDLISSYQWSFGDGSTNGTASIVNHTFNGTGGQTYNVVLTVKDEDSYNSAPLQLIINNNPIVSITNPLQGANYCYNATGSINFVGTVSDVEDGPLTGEWFYKIQGSPGNGTSFGIGNSKTLSMSSLSVNTYTISFVAVDSLGARGVNNVDVNIQDCSGISINEILANPSGLEPANEFTELYNNGTNSVNLTGWILRDSAGVDGDYIFTNRLINAGQFIVIYGNVSGMINLDNSANTISLIENNALINEISYLGNEVNSTYENFSKGKIPDGSNNLVNGLIPTPGSANRLPQCSDGIDNADPEDVLIDLADPGCANSLDDDETNVVITQCSNGIDDDGDGFIDLADFGCINAVDNDEVNNGATQCSDGIDNADPEDVLVDQNDPGCSNSADNDETNVVITQCSNGIDDDGDGFIDLADFGCINAVDNDEVNNGATQCSDGIDNADPEDVLVDQNDPGCSNSADNDETNIIITGQTIIDSTIYGTYYPFNLASDVITTNVTNSWVVHSTISGIKANITDSNITYTDLTLIANSTVTPIIDHCILSGNLIKRSTYIGPDCVYINSDPSYLVYNTIIGTGFLTTIDSNVTYSTITKPSLFDNSQVDYSIITTSNVTISTLYNVTAINSNITNTNTRDIKFENAIVNNNQICSGSITTNAGTYIATVCTDISKYIEYAPIAVLTSSIRTGVDSLIVNFSAKNSTDANLPTSTPLNDNLTYSWNFGDSTTDSIIEPVHTFSIGSYTIRLTVTDNFGKSNTTTTIVSVSSSAAPPATSGGGGGGGGSPGVLYCTEECFECTQWSDCSSAGTMTRTCKMVKKCQFGTPAPESKSCTYYPKEESKANPVVVNATDDKITGYFMIGPLELDRDVVIYAGIILGILLLLLIAYSIYRLTGPKIIEHKLDNKVAKAFVKKKK